MRVFDSKAAAGQELAGLVAASLASRSLDDASIPVLLGVAPNGLPVAEPVAQALGLAVQPASVQQVADGLQVSDLPEISGCLVIVVDDGVETGSAAMAIARALRSQGAARTILAVPVCPMEAAANLRLAYDEVIAIDTPLARRSLRWHYADWVDHVP